MENLKILSTTDVHGYKDNGLKNILDLDRDLFIDNGDFFIGSPVTFYSYLKEKENPFIKIANQLNYDVMIPGNHDLDFGIEYLKNIVKKLNCEYICANLVDIDDNLIFKPYVVIEKKGIKIAVIGLLTEGFSMLTGKYCPQEVYVRNPEEVLRNILDEIKGNVDFIVVCYHGGATIDPVSNKRWFYSSIEDGAGELISQFPEVNSFIYGHQHFTNAFINGKTCVIQPGSYGKFVGIQEVNISVNSILQNKVVKLEAEKWGVLDNDYQKWLNEKAPISEFTNYIKKTYKADKYLLEFKSKTIQEFANELEIPFKLGFYEVPGEGTVLATSGKIDNRYLKKNIIDTFFGNFLMSCLSKGKTTF